MEEESMCYHQNTCPFLTGCCLGRTLESGTPSCGTNGSTNPVVSEQPFLLLDVIISFENFLNNYLMFYLKITSFYF